MDASQSPPLAVWLAARGKGALARLHRSSGVSLPTLRQLARGDRTVRYDVAKAVEAATGGEVPLSALVKPDPALDVPGPPAPEHA